YENRKRGSSCMSDGMQHDVATCGHLYRLSQPGLTPTHRYHGLGEGMRPRLCGGSETNRTLVTRMNTSLLITSNTEHRTIFTLVAVNHRKHRAQTTQNPDFTESLHRT